MLTLILIIVLVTYILYILWSRRHIYRLHEQLKNETWCFPLLGNFLNFLGDDEDRMKALQKFGRIAINQGGMTSLWLGPKYFVMLADADVIGIILKTYLEKDDNVVIARELLGNGSIFAPVPIWRIRRKVLAPTFSLKNLNRFVEIFARQSTVMVKQLKESAGKGTFSVWKFITTYTMDSVCESTLGLKVQTQLTAEHAFLEAFEKHSRMASFRLLMPPITQKGYKYLPIYEEYMKHILYMHDFVDAVIRKKHVLHMNNKLNDYKETVSDIRHPKTFLELLIDSSGGQAGFTDMELREEALVLILAGTDTSAVGAAFTCLMLSRHKDVQDKVYEEIQEVFGDSSELTATDLPKLKYLEAVVKETLRLYPPVPVITRRVDKDCLLPSGLIIPRNIEIMINIWAVQRNPKYWGEDSEEFLPERFLGAGPIHPAAFIPFSNGPRSCLGYQYAMMSMKTALATLLRRYRIVPAKTHNANDARAPLRVKFNIMMKHVDNFELQLESRR